jgi:hypothetical protein
MKIGERKRKAEERKTGVFRPGKKVDIFLIERIDVHCWQH